MLAMTRRHRVMLTPVGKHRQHKDRTGHMWPFGRRNEPDVLFQRSFRTCTGCGSDVYVLAEDCRECGTEVDLVPLAG
jgi:hypothetical protein